MSKVVKKINGTMDRVMYNLTREELDTHCRCLNLGVSFPLLFWLLQGYKEPVWRVSGSSGIVTYLLKDSRTGYMIEVNPTVYKVMKNV